MIFKTFKTYKWIKRVCILDSSYSLLLYFLISKQTEIDQTFFFWSDGIPDHLRKMFMDKSAYIYKNKSLWNYKSKRNVFQKVFYYYVWSFVKFPFLLKRDVSYWGHDHLPYSRFLVHGNKMRIIEDGTMNYFPRPTRKGNWAERLLFGGPLLVRKEYCWQQDYCAAEYLTGIKPDAISMQSSKAIKISITELWNKSDEQKKNKICEWFDISKEEIETLRRFDSILLTSSYSEDGDLTEEEKIDMYKQQLENIDISKLVIKPHPREETDYTKFFPGVMVFRKKVPVELMSLLGVTFRKVYTVTSTAAYEFKNSEIVFWGNEINAKLYAKNPSRTSVNMSV